ncbi:MAG: ATP-dependent RNA helicase HrpA [Ottowia sp.]|nr:ATP-dependent RNA helicase HrpA [Ottowia sp.]
MNTAAARALPTIEFPPELPISARRAEIEAAVAENQVIIVCGETGSGKTTQLPKMMLAMGRGRMVDGPAQKAQRIGHTQPRRIAATSVARRIAQELRTPPGEVVGYKVRFQEQVTPAASIKLMTDGILLAETQSDPLLQAYDTIIIDEAHERSLNIDFLLGYLRQILPRRPDLKLIITSATIDADLFARHFGDGDKPAPVLMVSGRLYPVEQRYRPFEESREYGLNEAIADAVDELWQGAGTGGDILVFLPGEREIRDAARHLQNHLARDARLREAEVLPLFSRLSPAEQARIFDTHARRRIVLATNVAETSLTVPGIGAVIDAGTARVKRYSYRNKVERLLVEPISQAAANQRAGRCGRVADGICIRLYSEQDFARRPEFTDPEILRSSLAGVILRMMSLNLLGPDSEVTDFPFLQPPSARAVADGYQLLAELGAIDEQRQLTATGRAVARLPLDPRIARMIVAGRDGGALHEIMVIASALSTPDVRDRPLDKQAQADQQHARFNDAKSEFISYLKLWQWLQEARGGKPAAVPSAKPPQRADKANLAALPVAKRAERARAAAQAQLQQAGAGAKPTRRLSNRQYERLLREHYINPRRVREWRDVYRQLHTVVRERRWQDNPQPAGYEAVHKALLAGLLGNVGCRRDDGEGRQHKTGDYLGARGIRFFVHPGSRIGKKRARWVVCAELVETSRLYGRTLAQIQPQWIEEVAGDLLKTHIDGAHWEKKAGQVVAFERGLLYGLMIYQGRRVDYSRVDPTGARDILIRQALVGGDWPQAWQQTLPFLQANARLARRVENMQHKSRRQDLLVDDALVHAFYDAQIPDYICTGQQLQDWYRKASRDNPRLLHITQDELMRHEAAGVTTEAFPRLVRLGGVDCSARYLHAPGAEEDGLTVTVPLFVLNQIDQQQAEWLVPGMLEEKIAALLKTLPQKARHRLRPLEQTAAELAGLLRADTQFAQGDLLQKLVGLVRERTALEIRASDLRLTEIPPHLFMNFIVTGEHGRRLAMSRDLAALKDELGSQARGAFQALVQLKTRKPAAKKKPPAAAAKGGQVATAGQQAPEPPPAATLLSADARHTDWDFGPLPELMELRRKGQTLIGFPALIDHGDSVGLEVFDEPEVAAERHRSGLRRLFALQVSDALRQLRKNLPDMQKTALLYMPLGTRDELLDQILHVALERAFMEPELPADTEAFAARLAQGRTRLVLIAQEVARLAGAILAEYAAAQRRIREAKNTPDLARDAAEQLQRLVPPAFLATTPWPALRHLERYLKAVNLRFDKYPKNPERDAKNMAAIRSLEERYWRHVAQRKGQQGPRLREFRWMLEELRVGLFAQELRTPMPVSIKRLEKAWAQLMA